MNHVTVSSSPVKVTLRYGQKGERGIGISSVALDDKAHLIITYDDGKTQDAGAALGDVTSIKDGIDSTYKKIQASEANVTKLEASTKTNAEKAQQALQDTKSASTSGVTTINDLVTTKMTYMTTTFDTLLTQAKANIDQWERDAEDKIHKVRTYSLEQIKTAHDDAMVDIERSVNKAEAWAVSEGSPDREPDFESPTGLTQSSRSWALYGKNKVQEAAGTFTAINQAKQEVEQMKADTSALLNKAKLAEANAADSANQAHGSMTEAKKSETNANDYMEATKSDAIKVNKAITEAKNIANNLQAQLDNLDNHVKEITGEAKGALHILYLDNTTKDITLAQMGTYTSAQIDKVVSDSLTTAKSYTDTKVADLVNGAPDALDTLKELADVLNDNTNAAANMTKQLTDLSTSLAQETSARKAADDATNNNITTQVNKLQAADTALSNRLDAEVQNRETGDTDTYTKAANYTDTKVTQSNATLIAYVDNIRDNNMYSQADKDKLTALYQTGNTLIATTDVLSKTKVPLSDIYVPDKYTPHVGDHIVDSKGDHYYVTAVTAESGTKGEDDYIEASVTVGNAIGVNPLTEYQKTLTFDNTPTVSSTNPVTSGGIAKAISDTAKTKVDKDGYIAYTQNEKDKLAGIANHANLYTLPIATSNTLGGVKGGGNIAISDNGVISVDLTGYYTKNAATTDLAKKVDKVTGKQLSTEDYTTAEKTKLSGIDTGANNYSLPTASSGVLGGVKIGTNLVINNGVLTVDIATDADIANIFGISTTK